MNLLLKAIIMGFFVLIIGSMIRFTMSKLMTDLPSSCKDWNKYFIIEISLFFTGFFAHLLCEWIGMNKLDYKAGLVYIQGLKNRWSNKKSLVNKKS